MTKSKLAIAVTLSGLLGLLIAGCAPEVGSEQWCADLKEKPKGDWTANEAGDYTKHCLFK